MVDSLAGRGRASGARKFALKVSILVSRTRLGLTRKGEGGGGEEKGPFPQLHSLLVLLLLLLNDDDDVGVKRLVCI